MVTSRLLLPLTCGSWKPAATTALRTASRSTSSGKVASTEMPPVKSTAKFSPRTKNDANETTMRIADSVYHTLRVAMNGKLVFLWKNSMCEYLPSADGELRDLLLPAVDQREQRARAHQ